MRARVSWRASVRAFIVAAAFVAAFTWVMPAFASGSDILDSQTGNTQIRQAVNQSVGSNPDFTGQPWSTPAAGYNGAYSVLPGASWLAEVAQGGAPVNHRWDQYRATFDLPDGVTSAGVRLLVDNEATAMTINGVPFGCGQAITCNYFNGTRFAMEMPAGALQQTGNELLITVHNDENFATGGLTFAVVPAGIVTTQAPSNQSGYAGSTLNTAGGFQQNFADDASAHPLTITADNTVGSFVDNGNGTWSWTYDASTTGSGTIHVTASDDRGLTATESFDYSVTDGPTISVPGVSCLPVVGRYLAPFNVAVTGLPANYAEYFVFADLNGPVNENFADLYEYGETYLANQGSVYVGYRYQPIPASTTSVWVTLRDWEYERVITKVQMSVCGSDTTPPDITHTVDGTAGQNDWYTSDVHVSFSVDDAQSTVSSTNGCDSVDVTTDTDGETFTCTATSAGGTSEDSVTVKRDATAPTIAAAATSDPNGNGWYSGDVTVHFTCADDLSGIADGACPADQVLTGEGNGVSSTAATVTDEAGNTSDASNIVSADIDRTAPTVTVSPDGQTYDVDQTVSIACTAADALSGVDSTTCSDVDAEAWTLGLGTHSLSASATDRAGNTGDGSGSYTVKATFDGLCNLVKEWAGKSGTANSLCAKLRAAGDARARGQDKTADNQLDAFRHEVAAQSGKALTADQANLLTQFSQTL